MINLKRLGIRAVIVSFWISLIVAILFVSNIKKLFMSSDSINIFAWIDMIDTDKILKFEKETGIKVNINYYESYQELLAKLRVATPGEYDMLMITEYALNYFPENSFKIIDKSKLDFWHKIEPHFLDHPFDKGNKISIPFFWDIYGIGIDKSYITEQNKDLGWDLIFNEAQSLKPVIMINEALESMSIASLYLFGKANNMSNDQLYEIRDLLIKQKKWVEAYTDLKADYYLISQISPAVVTQSAYINRALKESNKFKFIIPKEGSFLVIDSIAIPGSSNKTDKVYKFICFLFQEELMKDIMEKNSYLPVLKTILDKTDLSYLGKDILSDERFRKLHFFGNFTSPDLLNNLWIEMKSA